MERSAVWSTVLPLLVPAHLLEVRDLLTGKHAVAEIAASGEYLDKGKDKEGFLTEDL